MREFQMGIIGGCLSHQRGMGYSQLYHRRLDKMLQPEGVHLRVSIARNFRRSYIERMEELLEPGHINGILLHLRIIFIQKIGLIVNYLNGGYRHYILHPFLFNRHALGWVGLRSQNFPGSYKLFRRKDIVPVTDTADDEFERPRPFLHLGSLRVRDIDLIAGIMLGLDNWVIRDELNMLVQFKEKCDSLDIPFFVLGPTPVNDSLIEDYLWRKFNRVLAAQLQAMQISYCLIEQKNDEIGNHILKPDGIHLNEKGHEFIAGRLHHSMSSWIKSALST